MTEDTKNTVTCNTNKVTQDQKKFRLVYKHISLTYSQCPLGKEKIRKHISEKFNPNLVLVCDEKHEDGNLHSHAYVWMSYKPNFKDPKVFDIERYHPEIQKVKNKEAWIAYVCKKGDIDLKGQFPATTWQNFNRNKADYDAWCKHITYGNLKSPFPFEDPNGNIVNKPEPNEKMCNYLIISEPDGGKTHWVNNTFEGKRIYSRTQDSTYPFDDYNDEEIILYDDVVPKIAELLQVSNCYKIRTPVYGNTRYAKKYWPLNVRRTMIILCNEQRIPSYWRDPAFISRFNIIHMTKKIEII